MSLGTTQWLALLQAGDARSAQPLWERYFTHLVALARDRLRGTRRRMADEEDVALSAFDSFCRGAVAGRFPRLSDSTDLWKLLVVITARKAADLVAAEKCLKRGGGAVRGESALLGPADEHEPKRGLEEVLGREPTPEFAAQAAEEYQRLLAALDDDVLRSVALWKLEGYTNEEIKGKLDCSLAKVERKLVRIRSIWQQVSQTEET